MSLASQEHDPHLSPPPPGPGDGAASGSLVSSGPVCSLWSAHPVLSPHSHLSVCLSVRACRVGGHPVSLAKWWRHLEVVPSPLLSLWRHFGCNLKLRRGCVVGIFAPQVQAPPPHGVGPATLLPSESLRPSCSSPASSLWPRPPGARPREVGADTGPRPRSRRPMRRAWRGWRSWQVRSI